MPDPPPTATGGRPWWVPALGAAAVVVVVGAAAGAGDPAEPVDPGVLGPRLLVTTLVLTMLAGLLLFGTASDRPALRLVSVAVAVVLVGVLVGLLEDPPGAAPRPAPAAGVEAPADPAAPGPTTPDGPAAWSGALDAAAGGLARGLLAAGLVTALAAGAAALVALGRRPRRPPPVEPSAPDDPAPAAPRAQLVAALDKAVGQLGDAEGSDPRRAVIAAYVAMVDVLATAGVVRDPADTPLELLARALRALDASAGAVTRLTALVETAMFSDHPMDRGLAAEARAALGEVRDELRSPAWA